MEDKKVKNFTKGIEEIEKLHPADRRGVKILISDLKIESFPKKKKIKS